MARALLGLLCAGLTVRWSGTPIGTVFGAVVLAFSCAGYGLGLARVVNERVSIGTALTTGFACMIVIGTLASWGGLLPYNVQVVVVGVGIAALLVPSPHTIDVQNRWVLGLSIAAGLGLVVLKVVDLSPWFSDGVNHTLEVKRLWDTGGIEVLGRQPGGLLVGQSLTALAGGVGTIGVFDAGLCAALLVVLLATELSTRKDDSGLPLFLLLALPIVINPEPSSLPMARWGGILFHAAAVFALYRGVRAKRFSWLLIPPLLGLVALRWELAVLASCYALGGVWLTSDRKPSRFVMAVLAVAWIVMFSLLRGHVLGGALAVVVASVALLGTWVLVPLVSTFPRRSAASVVVFAVIATALTSLILPGTLQSTLDAPTIWFGAAVAVLALIDRAMFDAGEGPRIRIGTAAIVIASMTAIYVLAPALLSQRRARIVSRLQHVVRDLRFASIDGYDSPANEGARSLQDLTGHGSSIGFLGLSAAELDFTRNAIRDVSWVRGRYSAPVPPMLVGLDFLLVEDLVPPGPKTRRQDPWGPLRLAPTVHVDSLLELVASRGNWRLYRVSIDRL